MTTPGSARLHGGGGEQSDAPKSASGCRAKRTESGEGPLNRRRSPTPEFQRMLFSRKGAKTLRTMRRNSSRLRVIHLIALLRHRRQNAAYTKRSIRSQMNIFPIRDLSAIYLHSLTASPAASPRSARLVADASAAALDRFRSMRFSVQLAKTTSDRPPGSGVDFGSGLGVGLGPVS